ncbi:MAG: hypothetical protein Q9169_002751 [Polycauliona sp. 2 TL-2023]
MTGTPDATQMTKVIDLLKPSASQFNRLVELIYTKLPQELFDQIQETTLELAICSGYILSKWMTFIWQGKPDSVARGELLRLSRAVYDKYCSKYWRENVLVNGHSPSSELFDMLDKVPANAFRMVRKVHLVLDFEDLTKTYYGPSGFHHLSSDNHDARYRWEYKMKRICIFPMTELTIEFTGTDTRYPAPAEEHRWHHPCLHGIPVDLHLIHSPAVHEARILKIMNKAR